MTIQTNLTGRLRNTELRPSEGLMPLFEAVVNSIQSIEEDNNLDNGSIVITVERDSQQLLKLGESDDVKSADIIGFTIKDNGICFNDANLRSFQTLDSEYKSKKGCRGIGRLLWLKSFTKIQVNSSFYENNQLRQRVFSFDAISGVGDIEDSVLEKSVAKNTEIRLLNFKASYRDQVFKSADTICNALIEHCLWYFVRKGGAPEIKLVDASLAFDINALVERYMHSSATSEKVVIKNNPFELTHLKLRASSSKNHMLAYCAANRLVTEEKLSFKDIAGLLPKLDDEDGSFIYQCYISSPYLDSQVRPERTSFNMQDSISVVNGELFDNSEISNSELKAKALNAIESHLSDYLSDNIEAGRNRVENFTSKTAPRYRPILKRMSEKDKVVDPNISDKDLEMKMHKHYAEMEREIISEGHLIMAPKDKESKESYEKRLKDYLEKVEEIKQSDLANYVFHRKVIIDLLENSIGSSDGKNYAREDLIHELIMPMREESNDIFLDSCNLWLLDERLAFHDFLASDKTLNSMPITENTSSKEPDLLALNIYDSPVLVSNSKQQPLSSIVVVEIKRPMRNDMAPGEEKDPIDQALGYLNRIREGEVKTYKQRPIKNTEDIPGYCYIVADLTPSMVRCCNRIDLQKTDDGLGYFGFHKHYKAYIEVMSYERLLNMAKQRNKAFFEKLGLPSN